MLDVGRRIGFGGGCEGKPEGGRRVGTRGSTYGRRGVQVRFGRPVALGRWRGLANDADRARPRLHDPGRLARKRALQRCGRGC